MKFAAVVCFVVIGLLSAEAKYSYPDPKFYAGIISALRQMNLTDSTGVCWKDSYGRGVGTPIDSCPAGDDKSGLLCYPTCEPNYSGVGPVCWENCEAGFTDEGALCGKSGSIVPADNSNCPWYDKCGLVTAKGCSTCADPAAHNDGCTCRIDPVVYAKKSYGRGVGTPLVCASDKEYDAGLCYPFCKTSYYGIGPVCWESCPTTYPNANGALCCQEGAQCNQKVVEMATAVLNAVAAAIEAGEDPSQVLEAVKKAIEAILGFVLPLCSDFP